MISAAAIFAACDQLSVDEIEVVAPVIESFSPESAPVGAVVTITGKYLNNVTEAYIGSVKVGQTASFTVDAYTGKTFTATPSEAP